MTGQTGAGVNTTVIAAGLVHTGLAAAFRRARTGRRPVAIVVGVYSRRTVRVMPAMTAVARIQPAAMRPSASHWAGPVDA